MSSASDGVPRCALCHESIDGAAPDAPCPRCACRIERRAGHDVAVVTTPEFLDSDNCDAFEESLMRCLDAGIRRFVIDAAALSYMSSAGAGVFIHLLSRVGKGKGGVVFAGTQLPVDGWHSCPLKHCSSD